MRWSTPLLTLILAVGASSSLFAADPVTQPTTQAVVATDVAHTKVDAKTGLTNEAWLKSHEKLVARAKEGNVDLMLLGDSITAAWATRGKGVFAKEFAGQNAAQFGIGGDRTEHVLWRLDHGELDGISPKVIVLLIGTNNSGDHTGAEIASGVTAIVKELREKEPQSHVILMAIFPRGDVAKESPVDKRRTANEAANKIIASLADGDHVTYLDINSQFPPVGTPEFKAMFHDLLHPEAAGYQIWADALKPYLEKWIGPATTTMPATPAN